MTAFDYTVEMDLGGQAGLVCMSAFAGAEGFAGEDAKVVLGNAFLRRWYGVFDFERRRVGCKFDLFFLPLISCLP